MPKKHNNLVILELEKAFDEECIFFANFFKTKVKY